MTRAALIPSVLICMSCWTAICAAEEKPSAASGPVERWPPGRTIFAATELEKRIHAALARPLVYEFKEMTLEKLAKFLEEKLQCTVLLDLAPLEADGIKLDRELDGKARGRSSLTELRALLEPERMTIVVRDECIRITTKTAAETERSIRIYQVHDLVVGPNDAAASVVEFETLSHLLKAQCRLEFGNEICFYEIRTPGVLGLALNETDVIHERVEDLLAQLRGAEVVELRRLQERTPLNTLRHESAPPTRRHPLPPPPPLPRGKVLFRQTAEEKRIRDRLLGEAKFDFTSTSLEKVCAEIEAKYKVIFDLDRPALFADGKGPDSEISFHWRCGSLRSALSVMLEVEGLAYVVRNDAVLITTRTAAESIDERHVYQVHDLVPYDWTRAGGKADLRGHTELITGLIAPESWSEGNRSMVDAIGFEAAGLQVVSVRQTQSVHDEVETFFALLREAYEPKVYEVLSRRPIVLESPQAPQHPAVRGMGGGF